MNRPSIDNLEMELRILGRQMSEDTPSPELLERTTAASAAHLVLCAQSLNRRRQLRLLLGAAGLVGATFPIPLLFLWGDWAAASALFGKILSPAASEVASTIYLWVRFCALSLIYVTVLPLLTLWALRTSRSIGMQPEMNQA